MSTNFNLNHLRDFYHANVKRVNFILIAVALLIGGVYYYFEFYQKPREEKANEAMFHAQRFFQKDSLDLALNGKGKDKGFLSIIKNYSGTQAAELAKYYAGIIFLQKGQFQKAIDILSSFSSKSSVLEGYCKGALADAYSEMKENDKAVKLYKEAAKELKNDNVWGAENLLKAALLLEVQNKNEEAIATYKELKELFPEAKQKQIAEKSLFRLGSKD